MRVNELLSWLAGHDLRTIDDHGDVVLDCPHSFINASNPIVNAHHPIVNINNPIRDSSHPLIDSMRDFQNLCSSHSSFLLCQLVQPFQPIFHVRPSHHLLHIFL